MDVVIIVIGGQGCPLTGVVDSYAVSGCSLIDIGTAPRADLP